MGVPSELFDYIRSWLTYDPETGALYWSKSGGDRRVKGRQWGSKSSSGYINGAVMGRSYRAHTIIWIYMTGEYPSEHIDHINGVRDDNRWCNLRMVSNKENSRNSSLSSSNKTGVTGVYLMKRDGVYVANICVDGKTLYLGRYKELSSAAKARKMAEIKYGFHENHGKRRWYELQT